MQYNFTTIPELAKLLGLSRIAVYNRVKKGQIPAVRVGHNYAIRQADVRRLLSSELTQADKRRIDEAVAILQNAPKPVARKVEKLLKSAAANAENNYQLAPAELRVKAAFANEGTRLKRMRAGPRGRAKPWVRRFSHITIVVEDRG